MEIVLIEHPKKERMGSACRQLRALGSGPLPDHHLSTTTTTTATTNLYHLTVITETAMADKTSQPGFDPPPPPRWVVSLNTPLPRPSKAAANIPDPPGFSRAKPVRLAEANCNKQNN